MLLYFNKNLNNASKYERIFKIGRMFPRGQSSGTDTNETIPLAS